MGWRITVILDKEPLGEGRELRETHPKADYAWPKNPLSYASHDEQTRVGGDIINQAKGVNFATTLRAKLAQGMPDHILINTPDAVVGVNQLGLATQMPTTYYTHHENLIAEKGRSSKIFSQAFNDFLYTIPPMPGYKMATQSSYNLKRMSHHRFSTPPVVLPMPIPDVELMKQYTGQKNGVRFIGRHGREKDSNFFAKIVAAAGLPAKVITMKEHIPLFEETFAQAGITDFEVKGQIIAKEKADFILSAKVAFHPSQLESYGFCALETLVAGLPTLLLEDRNWWQSFKGFGVSTTTRETAVDDLLALYRKPLVPTQIDWERKERDAFRRWRAYFDNPVITQAQLEALDRYALAA